jgi:hypothetical protein
MQKLLVVIAVASLFTACSSVQPLPPQAAAPQTKEIPPVTIAQQPLPIGIPAWFGATVKSDTAVIADADGISSEASGALQNAVANAFARICQDIGGTVRSQQNLYRRDTEQDSTFVNTAATKVMCKDIDIRGSVIDHKEFVRDGHRIRAYVRVRYPILDNNVLGKAHRTEQAQRQAQRQAQQPVQKPGTGSIDDEARREFQDLDKSVEGTKPVVKSVSQAPAQAPAQSTVATVNLLDVDNAEYKRKRDEALQKPGAVVGQVTLR